MKDDKKKRPAEEAAEQISVSKMNEASRQEAIAEEKEAIERQEEEKSPGFFARVGARLHNREQAAKQRRSSSQSKFTPDRTLFLLAAIPFWAVAGTTLKNAIALSFVLILTLIPASALRYILRRQVGVAEWIALPASVVVATMLATVSCMVLFLWLSPSLYDSLGAYLFLLVAAPILMNTECNGVPSGIREFWKRTFRFIADFIAVLLLTGGIREVLAYGAIFDIPLKFMGTFRMEAARQPFFGLIFSGFLLAIIRMFHRLLHKRIAMHGRRTASGEEASA